MKIIILLLFGLVSCKQKTGISNDDKSEILKVKTESISDSSYVDSIRVKNFLEKIEKEEYSKLPNEQACFFFIGNDNYKIVDYENNIINDFSNRDTLLSLNSNFINTKFLKKINPYDNIESIKIDEVFFNKKFKINDSISSFTSLSFRSFSGVIYPKFIFTYNHNKNIIIDNEIINLFCSVDLWNIHTGTYISENNEIRMIMHSGFENDKGISERKLKIHQNGKIEIIDLKSYEIDIEKDFHDYQNDYKKLEITPIAVDEKFQLFNQFKNDIPIVTLPYNSKEFYSLMQIESPENVESSDTKLYHDQLSWNENVKHFFSKDPNTIAFKPKGKDYDQGYYFYPIGQIPIGGEHTGILYLYQSFCNYHPTVYVQLNTYDKQGNILAEQILDRRFYSGMYRFLSSIEIQEDLQINIKQFIQDYEGYDDTNQNSALKKPEMKEFSYQVTPQGKIT